jgi:ribosomal protein S18 acetylase RimI-like enzyme
MNKEPKTGCFFTYDKNDRAVVIEWHKTNILAAELADFKKEVSDFAAQITAESETNFLKSYPEAVQTDGFLKSCQPLFENGSQGVDWDKVIYILQSSIKQFYTMDLSLFGPAIINKLIDDVYFFASVKDVETQKLLGFMMTSITPVLPKGDIKLINLVIASDEQKCGLEQLLLSSIIKILPQVKRIFTMVRPTNVDVQRTFEVCGFMEDKNPIEDPNHPIHKEHFIVLEYKIDQSNVLQRAAMQLVE